MVNHAPQIYVLTYFCSCKASIVAAGWICIRSCLIRIVARSSRSTSFSEKTTPQEAPKHMPQLAARIHRLEHSGCCLPLQQFWWAWYHGTEHRVHQQLWTASWYTEWFAHSSARLASGNASSPSIQFHFEGFDKTINLRPQFSCHKSQADTMCYHPAN